MKRLITKAPNAFKQKNLFSFFLLFVLLTAFGVKGWGQITMTTTGSNTQNFNALANSGTSNTWTDNSTIANWYSQRTGSGTTYAADAGNSTSGNLYSYGTGTNSDRALGTIGSSNTAAGSFAHGVLLRNTSGVTITDIKITYTLEQWRNSAAAAQSITFYYKTSSSAISSLTPNNNTGWTQVAGLTLSSPITGGTAGALDGNAAGNKVTASNVSIPSLSLANNDYIMLKWEDPDHTGTDHGLSIDDVTISWTVTSCTAPTTQASEITFQDVQPTQMIINWTNGNGSKRIVKINTSNSFTNPTDGIDPTANTVYGGSGEQVVYNNSSNSVTVTGLTASTTYWFRVYEANCSGSSVFFNIATATNNPNSQATSAACSANPTITTTTTASSITASTASSGGSTIGTGGGTCAITAKGVCWKTSSGPVATDSHTSDGTGTTDFTSSITGLSAQTLYYVRAYATNSYGSAYGNEITLRTLSAELTAHPASFTAAAASTSQINLSFSAASTIINAYGYLIIQRQGANPTGTPTDATGYSVGNTIGDGTVAAIITNSAATSAAITGLTANTQYNYSIIAFSYDGTNTSTYNYYTAATIKTAYSSTLKNAPTTQASALTFSSVGSTSMTVNWTSGNGDKRVVIMNTSNSFTNPSDGTDPSANTVYGGSGEQVVYNNNSNTVTVTNLTASTTYWFRVYECNNTGANTKYITSTATDNPKSQATTTGSLWTNPITGTNPNSSNPYTTGQSVASNITVSGIGRGSGITGTNANDRYNAEGWSTGALDANDYFEFTLTPSSGYKINFTNFVYTGKVSTGSPSFALRSSIDGFTANIGSPNETGTTIDLSGTSYQNISSAITFRFYVYNMAAGTTTYSINDFTFNGTVVPLGNSTVMAVASSEPATISSVENTPNILYNTEGTQVWQFDLYDGDGTSNDADALPTNYTQWTITQGSGNTVSNWFQTIQSIKFFEGSNTSPIDGNLTLNATSVVFSPNSVISVPDGAASKKRITVRISLVNVLPDNSDDKVFQFKLTNSNIYTEGSSTSSQLNSITINSDGTKNKIDVSRTKLVFKSAPSTVPVSSNFGITVIAADANGNLDAEAVDNITLAKYSGATGAVSTVSGTSKTLSAGSYTWSDVQYSAEETFVLQVTASGLTTGYSNDILCVNAGTSATTLVKWDFPNTTDDQYADGGIALNYDAITPSNSKPISVSGASGLVYTYSGFTTRSAYASGWNSGSGTKYWQVYFATTGYSTIKVSSKQKSSTSGPKNWKIQYKIGAGGTWTDVTGGSITVLDDNFVSGVASDKALPSGCDNQAAVYVRWIMTANTAVDGGTVASGGTSRIDDILITGVSLNSLTTGTIAGSPYCISSSTGASITVPYTSAGTYNSGNVYTAQLSNASGSFTNAVDIGTYASTANSGSINATIPAGTTNGNGYRIRVVSSDPAKTGSDNGVNLAVVLNTPDVLNINVVASNQQVVLGWIDPLGCYDDVMIIGKANSNVTAIPSGDGTAYNAGLAFATAGTNTNLPTAEYCLYKGLTSGQIITALTNETTYFFKIFVRKGTTWSAGVVISAATSASNDGDFRTRDGVSGNFTNYTSWQIYKPATGGWRDCTIGEVPTDLTTTANVLIRSGSTVTLDNSNKSCKNLVVENGAKLYANISPVTLPGPTYNNKYINLYGNLRCDGIIGNGSTPDGISFNIEGVNTTISGNGSFDASRIRKNSTTNNTTNLIISMNINLRWNAESGTQIYNNVNSIFNIILNSGSVLNLIVSSGIDGNASINGTSGSGSGGGTWTINGSMNIPGILYAKTNAGTNAAKWVIGNGGVVTCNYIECAASGGAGHEIEILNGGKLNLNTNNGFNNFSSTNNVYDFQDGSIVEYSSPSGTQAVKATIQNVFEYSNLLISTNGGTKQLAGDVVVKKDLTISGGILDASTYNISLGRNWDNYGTGGFTEGSTASVSFNGTGAQTISCPGGENFYKLNFSGSGTKTLYDDISVVSDLTINSGSGAFTANGKNINIGGNWTNYGTGGFNEGTAGTVTFNGTTQQTLTCPGNEDFYNVTLNNSAGLNLNCDAVIANLLSLSNGKINTSANKVDITSSSENAIIGYQADPTMAASATNYVNGNLRRMVAITGLYDFPIGTSSYYEFASLKLNGISGGLMNLSAKFTSPNTGTTPNGIYLNGSEITTLLDYGFWTITPNAGTANYDIYCVSYGHNNGGYDATQHTLIKRANSTSTWLSYELNHNNATQIGTNSSPILAKLSGMTGFSDFAIGKGSGPLPIELLDFKGTCKNNKAELFWSTASETNNDYFTIESSRDFNSWSVVGTVNGSGNANHVNNYSFTDKNIEANPTYYRLMQTDFNGKSETFEPISVSCDNAHIEFQVYPNPATKLINCNIHADVDGDIILDVIDMHGTIVSHNKLNVVTGDNLIPIELNNLESGIYSVVYKDADGKIAGHSVFVFQKQ